MATTVSGYSGTPLPKKLGLKEGGTMVLINAPVGIDQLMVRKEKRESWNK